MILHLIKYDLFPYTFFQSNGTLSHRVMLVCKNAACSYHISVSDYNSLSFIEDAAV